MSSPLSVWGDAAGTDTGVSHLRCVTPVCLCQVRCWGRGMNGVVDRTVFFHSFFFGGIHSRGFSAYSKHRDESALQTRITGLHRDWGSLVLNCRCQTEMLRMWLSSGCLKWFLIWRVGKTNYYFWNSALNFSLRCTIKLQPGIIKIICVWILRLQLLFLFCVQLRSRISYKLFWKPNFSFYYFDQFSIDLICNDCFLYC